MSEGTREEYRILLVDDEPDVVEALANTLRRAKEFAATVDTATTADEALDRLGERTYHLVLADHRMPGTPGIDLLARVAQSHPDVVRALITGYTDLDIALEAVDKARVHYYVQKPWDNEELRVTVREALKGAWKAKL